MLLMPEQPETAPENLYFTLKYVAGYSGRSNMGYRHPTGTAYSFLYVDTEARRSIDALLYQRLPEVELWRETQRIEAKLFGASRPYTPFF